MNKGYRVVWSAARQALVVAHENAAARGKPSSTRKAAGRAILSALLAAGCGQALATDLIFDASPPAITTAEVADNSFWVGVNNPAGVAVTIGAGGSVTVNGGGNSATVGVNGPSDGNSLVISGTPSALTVVENLNVGNAGANNVFTVGTGGAASASYVYIGALAGSTGNTATVSGTGTLTANNNLVVGYGDGGNALNVQTGGHVTNVDATLGLVAAAPNNTATVAGTGALWTSTGVLYLGYASSGNQLTVSGTGKVAVDTQDALIGATTGANNNRIRVTGGGSQLSNANGTLYVGRSGNGNELHVESGGVVTGKNVRIGGGTGATGSPTGNGAFVDGTGSTWNVSGTLRVGAGAGGIGSGLDITGGGIVNVTGNSFLGYDATSDGNHVTVAGAGSQFNAHALVIGNVAGSTGNVLALKTGGALLATAIAIGEASGIDIGAGAAAGTLPTPVTITGTLSGAYVRFSQTDGSYTFASPLAGTIGVVHDATGITTLTGATSYTGPTTVNAGILRFDSVDASTAVAVNGSGTLGGTGTVGAVTLAGAAHLAPGAGPGIIHTGDLAMPAGTHFDVELNGPVAGTGYDQASVTGTVALGGTLDVALGFVPLNGSTFTIIANDGSDAVVGGTTFSGLPEGATFVAGNVTFRISYAGGTGNDVVLTAVSGGIVPPSAIATPALSPLSLAALAIVILLAGLARRRQA